MEDQILNLILGGASPAAFAVFAVLLWKRTERTLTYYEETLTGLWTKVATVLDRIDERTRNCNRNQKEPPE